jgi:hypothetical protein
MVLRWMCPKWLLFPTSPLPLGYEKMRLIRSVVVKPSFHRLQLVSGLVIFCILVRVWGASLVAILAK